MIEAYQPKSAKKTSVEESIRSLFTKSGARELHFASAYLSPYGAAFVADLISRLGGKRHRAVVGISQRITHPDAIRNLLDSGIDVRLGRAAAGIFHPKLMVGVAGTLRNPQPLCAYIGSANMTFGGLRKNVESVLCTVDPLLSTTGSSAFDEFWNSAQQVSEKLLNAYEKSFSLALQERSVKDLQDFGLELERLQTPGTLSATKVPTIANSTVVWVGLQSFTGDYDLQVEFPRLAGKAFEQLAKPRNRKVKVLCGDGTKRTLIFDYYESNSMYRLNVPNDLPLVSWVRRNRSGCLKIEKDSVSNVVRAEILKPSQMRELVEKSRILGTLGVTSTRQYGWF